MDERLAKARIFITDYVAMLGCLDRKKVLSGDHPHRVAAMEALKEAREWLAVTDSAGVSDGK